MKQFLKYLPFLFAAILMVLIFPSRGKFNYHYHKGSPWIYETLIAEIDFPILKSEAELLKEREEKASIVVDCYTFHGETARLRMATFEKDAAEFGYDPVYAKTFREMLSKVMETGLVSGFDDGGTSDKVILVSNDKRVKEIPAEDVYTVDQVIAEFKYELYGKMSAERADSLINILRPELYLTPDLIYDSAMTQLLHKEEANYISPTKGMIYAGQLIVSNGELITAGIEEILDSYKIEYEKSYGDDSSFAAVTVSHIIFILFQLLLLVICIYFFDCRLLNSTNKVIFVLLMVFISFAGTVILSNFSNSYNLLFPYAVIALFLYSFFNGRTAFAIYLISLLPVLVIADEGVSLFFISLASGSVALCAFRSMNRGWKQFLNALFIFIAMFLVYTSFRLSANAEDMIFRGNDIIFMAVSSVLVIMTYPFVFLFEKLFSLVSHSRLWELSDTNSTLLREMARLAPGTFQHSLQVANLAEDAARKVGGYPMLARVGALYHDIGKMENPVCFVENQGQADGSDYHKDLSPEASAHDILRHVDDGMALARKHSLPTIVSDFILTHHGRTMVRYFYNVYCNAGGDSKNVEQFTYNGMLPQTKEQAVLMMADSVEAASRTLKNYNPESISALVDKIVDGKMDENQFDEADITLKEIGMAKEAFKTYLQQIYHARITYPKRKRTTPEAAAPRQ